MLIITNWLMLNFILTKQQSRLHQKIHDYLTVCSIVSSAKIRISAATAQSKIHDQYVVSRYPGSISGASAIRDNNLTLPPITKVQHSR
ncbi:hypothetical protein RB195_008397 [Necator americanus]|uniref:Uncharacterized protein n=1 Tax=Necator americanus TaxID=51031 RepID=A0ABR1CNF7_NECAM